MANINNTELTPPAIPESTDVAQQVANEMLGIESTSHTVLEDPIDFVLRENGFTDLSSNNSVIQREDSIVVVPRNNRPVETRPITNSDCVDAEVVEMSLLENNTPISEEEQVTSESEQERLDAEEESERLAAESEVEEYEGDEEYDANAEENQDINVDEVLQTAASTDVMELAIASAMEGAETVSNEAPVEISKEDLLTELRHKLNISHLSYREKIYFNYVLESIISSCLRHWGIIIPMVSSSEKNSRLLKSNSIIISD